MTADALEAQFREEWPRVLAAVVRYTGSVELAEDAVQEAFARAAAQRERQLLINPAAWVTTTAKRIAVDMVRRDRALRDRLPLLAVDTVSVSGLDDDLQAPGGDDRLGLLVAACTPTLPTETSLALALRFVFGVPTSAIADVMLVEHSAMSARLTRAKRRIEREGIRFALEDEGAVGDRLDDVRLVVYALYTLGHTFPEGEAISAPHLIGTALELVRVLHRLMPDDSETTALLALILLSEARSPSRRTSEGGLATLEDADRSRWDRGMIAEGLALAAQALPSMSRFSLEAAIAGLHSQAPSWAETDWASIVLLYDYLVERWPSPTARLSRIFALSFAGGKPEEGLAQLDALAAEEADVAPRGALRRQLVAGRAELLLRAGRLDEAANAYHEAADLEDNAEIRLFYLRRMARATQEGAGSRPYPPASRP